jgi:20S proteasome alpha/beta subunit
MTTIAYKDGIIAFDSRVCTDDNRVTVKDYDKSRKVGGVKFFFAGLMPDIEEFIADYLSGDYDDLRPLGCVVFVVDHGRLYLSGVDEDGHLWRDPYSLKQHAAIGSGSAHALTAMDLGCDAKTAVKMAMLRDTRTGGRIRTYRIPTGKAK